MGLPFFVLVMYIKFKLPSKADLRQIQCQSVLQFLFCIHSYIMYCACERSVNICLCFLPYASGILGFCLIFISRLHEYEILKLETTQTKTTLRL